MHYRLTKWVNEQCCWFNYCAHEWMCGGLQERSSSGRVPVKLKLGLKQGGREQQVRSYTLSFPQAAAKQLQATAVGSVDPSASQSSAVHTLIPNLAPISRLQHPSLAKGTSQQMQYGSTSGNNKQLDALPMQAQRQLLESVAFQDPAGETSQPPWQCLPGLFSILRKVSNTKQAVETLLLHRWGIPFFVCFVQLLSGCCLVFLGGLSWRGMFCHWDFADWQNIQRKGVLCGHASSMNGAGEAPEGAADCESRAADNPAQLLNSSQNHVQNWLESGVHQAARSAIFQAALGLLKPKLVQPVMVNFMSVGGTLHHAQCQQLKGCVWWLASGLLAVSYPSS